MIVNEILVIFNLTLKFTLVKFLNSNLIQTIYYHKYTAPIGNMIAHIGSTSLYFHLQFATLIISFNDTSKRDLADSLLEVELVHQSRERPQTYYELG